MDVCYFGTPDYSRALLWELSKHHRIVCVISNPDSISDRSRKWKPSPVSELALEQGWKLLRPQKLKDPEFLEEFFSNKYDIGIVFSYGKILPKELLEIPKYGILNLHGSLLPDLRGASPLQTAIMKGYTKSGWTLQKVSEKMDEGDIVAQVAFEIQEEETTGELLQRVLPLGIELVLEVLGDLERYLLKSRKQDPSLATYCYKITDEVSRIDWKKSSQEIHNLIRALNPNPIAHTTLKKHDSQEIFPIKIYRSRWKMEPEIQRLLEPHSHDEEGKIVFLKYQKKNRIFVKTSDGWIEILELQYPNKKILNAHDFVNGKFIQEGEKFI
ncbi:MAG: methionyl-tRNA formyltransferase [Leptospiraceae bacterium]|nr:methionyl-tRNA formyltransferase [Leptospiraceae bacterium]MDW7975403.1 methionyl-tRNA formyltransferase [Leptospiraceae bacterium]